MKREKQQFSFLDAHKASQHSSAGHGKGRGFGKGMPCLDIATNVNLDGVDIDSIFSEATKTVAAIIGKPENFVMVLLKGSVPISFGGSKEPAALGEIISMGGINREVKRKLIGAIGTILENKLTVPRTRFVLKVYDTTMGRSQSKM